ncbi:MAG: CPBP family intramembrane metalloprotease [Gemmataceae bacterium]|nr:CPBP family intramembrane metalloprotease [Gemmataceae bacterium]
MRQNGPTLTAFVLLAYGLTWACWLSISTVPAEWAETLATLGQFGLLVAALAVAGVAGGWRDLLGRLCKWRVHPLWFGLALLLPGALALAALVLTDQTFDIRGAYLAPDVVPHFVLILLVGGPLGEELGWRGFALPRLQTLCPPLLATFLLALIWAGWHLPLWWVADVPCSFGLYVVGVIPLTFLFTWLSAHCGGSVLVAMLFHASINTCLARLPLFPAFPAWTGLLWVAAVIVYLLDRGSGTTKSP